MKKLVLVLLVFYVGIAFAGTPKTADYNVTIHVVSSRTTIHYFGKLFNRVQVLAVEIDGRKYELESIYGAGDNGVLVPGNYKAKVTDSSETKYDVDKIYEFLLPDGKTRKFLLTEISE